MEIKRQGEYLYEIPADSVEGMGVPAMILADGVMMEQIKKDRTLSQIVNVACLPGIVDKVLVMPDAHEGYGFPIGGVAATRYPDGIISPGGIGYDINCGVRLLKSRVSEKELRPFKDRIISRLYAEVPSGVGKSGKLLYRGRAFDHLVEEGAPWIGKEGFGEPGDLENIESGGYLQSADSACVSEKARERGRDQIGTMGAGNHFIEIAKVERVFDRTVATAYGLFENQVVILLHTGSRGFGHQIATDHIRMLMKAYGKYGIDIRDKELVCAPLSSKEGKMYFGAMSCAANFAWANRQVITFWIRQVWKEFYKGEAGDLKLLYDVAHNIAKIEKRPSGGEDDRLIVHRKGATRAFGPGHEELPPIYRNFGQPVIVPGSMGTSSHVMAGMGAELSFSSCCHGAGRRLSRSAAKRKIDGAGLMRELEAKGIRVKAGSLLGLAEEAPEAYKDVDNVVDVVEALGIARKVVQVKPLAVIKG